MNLLLNIIATAVVAYLFGHFAMEGFRYIATKPYAFRSQRRRDRINMLVGLAVVGLLVLGGIWF